MSPRKTTLNAPMRGAELDDAITKIFGENRQTAFARAIASTPRTVRSLGRRDLRHGAAAHRHPRAPDAAGEGDARAAAGDRAMNYWLAAFIHRRSRHLVHSGMLSEGCRVDRRRGVGPLRLQASRLHAGRPVLARLLRAAVLRVGMAAAETLKARLLRPGLSCLADHGGPAHQGASRGASAVSSENLLQNAPQRKASKNTPSRCPASPSSSAAFSRARYGERIPRLAPVSCSPLPKQAT
ncbi:hypothetical protein ABIF79_003701 [Bradyrhizobium japonicum]